MQDLSGSRVVDPGVAGANELDVGRVVLDCAAGVSADCGERNEGVARALRARVS